MCLFFAALAMTFIFNNFLDDQFENARSKRIIEIPRSKCTKSLIIQELISRIDLMIDVWSKNPDSKKRTLKILKSEKF